ncbi:MAG: multidrug effflux MFS transporter [Qingshengfaniella sp.]
MAMMFATMAFSIDSMLPALPAIAADMSPSDPNRAQLIVTSFIFGMGIGTLFTGPISDSVGRKPVIIGGGVVYCIGALMAARATTLETVLLARALMGLGAAGPRVVVLAIIRDLYKGRAMAQTMSFIMTVFTIVPAIAPSIGAVIIAFSGWDGLFYACMIFSLITMLWLGLRQPETLPTERRTPLRFGPIFAATRELVGNALVMRATLIQSLIAACMFAMISSTQQVFDITFDRGDSFPLWFGGVAIFTAMGTFANARLVMKLGMRKIVNLVLGMELVLSGIMMLVTLAGLWPEWLAFPAFVIWMASVFFTIALGMGNMNALAMEPVGHIAGMAASLIGCASTVLGVGLAVPVGLMFNGTILPLSIGLFIFSALAVAILRTINDPLKDA